MGDAAPAAGAAAAAKAELAEAAEAAHGSNTAGGQPAAAALAEALEANRLLQQRPLSDAELDESLLEWLATLHAARDGTPCDLADAYLCLYT